MRRRGKVRDCSGLHSIYDMGEPEMCVWCGHGVVRKRGERCATCEATEAYLFPDPLVAATKEVPEDEEVVEDDAA